MYFLSSSSSVLNELWAINFLFQVPEICYVAYKLVQRRSHVPVCRGGQTELGLGYENLVLG